MALTVLAGVNFSAGSTGGQSDNIQRCSALFLPQEAATETRSYGNAAAPVFICGRGNAKLDRAVCHCQRMQRFAATILIALSPVTDINQSKQ